MKSEEDARQLRNDGHPKRPLRPLLFPILGVTSSAPELHSSHQSPSIRDGPASNLASAYDVSPGSFQDIVVAWKRTELTAATRAVSCTPSFPAAGYCFISGPGHRPWQASKATLPSCWKLTGCNQLGDKFIIVSNFYCFEAMESSVPI